MMDEALIEIRNLLQTEMGSAAASYYAGDIGTPYKTSLPAVIVREEKTIQKRQSTAKDMYNFAISILVVTDIAKALDVAGTANKIVKARQTLRKLIEEADVDGAPKTTTVLGALSKQANIRGTNFIYNINMEVNYKPSLPSGFYYAAAEVTGIYIAEFVTRKP